MTKKSKPNDEINKCINVWSGKKVDFQPHNENTNGYATLSGCLYLIDYAVEYFAKLQDLAEKALIAKQVFVPEITNISDAELL